MAYFECMVGGAGGGATITVTYNSSFYNKTMTCSNGTKTYTKTTTSSGSTEFKVSDEGTWTITCNGVSRTVNVVLNYSTQMAVTKTITVYGAVGATISFTDAVGSKTVTLDNSGQGSASITFIPPSQTITFTDTNVAKNPDNLSQNYSKSIAITESTTSIKVMPDGALYWYGWNSGVVQNMADAGWSDSYYATYGATWNTNSIYINNPSSSSFVGVDFNNGQPGTGTERYKIICESSTALAVVGYPTKNNYPYATTTYSYQMSGSVTTYETTPAIPAGTYFFAGTGTVAGRTGTIYAIIKIA